MPRPRAPSEEPKINADALPEVFGSEKAIIVEVPLASSSVEKQPPESNYLEWNTPLEALYADLEQLPSSVTRYTDPFTWPRTQKNAIMVLAGFSTALGAYAAGAYTSGMDQMMEEWHVSRMALLVGIVVFTIGFAVPPMVLSPLSEVSIVIFSLVVVV